MKSIGIKLVHSSHEDLINQIDFQGEKEQIWEYDKIIERDKQITKELCHHIHVPEALNPLLFSKLTVEVINEPF